MMHLSWKRLSLERGLRELSTPARSWELDLRPHQAALNSWMNEATLSCLAGQRVPAEGALNLCAAWLNNPRSVPKLPVSGQVVMRAALEILLRGPEGPDWTARGALTQRQWVQLMASLMRSIWSQADGQLQIPESTHVGGTLQAQLTPIRLAIQAPRQQTRPEQVARAITQRKDRQIDLIQQLERPGKRSEWQFLAWPDAPILA